MAPTETATVTEIQTQGPDIAFFTTADNVVLRELYQDIEESKQNGKDNSTREDRAAFNHLNNLCDAKHPDFQPTVFASWDYTLRDVNAKAATDFRSKLLAQYIAFARTVVRHDTDVVFLSHIIMYFATSVPSAIYLFYDFHYFHGILHVLMQVWYSGSFTLMMHNHIHNNGVLQKSYSSFDWTFPYILEPLMGHTWDSYYYHHVKAHHVEGNGPDDLSTTIRYQRDSVLAFLHYQMRFLLLCWFDLTSYFVRKGKYKFAMRVLVTELSSYAVYLFLARTMFKPALFVLIIPFIIMRLGLMTGNWGQHALVDEVDPNSDFRSSITLIDVPSNRFCFNDGYHTSHHLNPLRHWRDHPQAFLKAKDRYSKEGALVFQNIDYLEITFRLLTKNYMHLAKQLVPMGSQIGMSQTELAEMLRKKTRKFSEEEIAVKFKRA